VYGVKRIDWDVVSLLGAIPDTTLAREMGVAPQVVWKARVRRGIPRFRSAAETHAARVDWSSVDLGRRPDAAIARECGVTRRRVCYERSKRGIRPSSASCYRKKDFRAARSSKPCTTRAP